MPNEDYHYVNDLIILKKKHHLIRHIDDSLPTPEIHGTKVWGSSFLIMDYLEENPPTNFSEILEVGCGWGLLGIHCAKTYGAEVTAVDADPHVFPYLDAHSVINDVELETLTARYEDLKIKDMKGYDMVLGGDICFWDELVEPLFAMIQKALKAKVCTIIIADPGRSPFLALAKRCQQKFDAEVIERTVRKPRRIEGKLLIIRS